ncbi:glycosyltransferase [Pollutibacter soli]|uniref:glycosyltransferase n=1 Tax=Pollutibacter soli TaxID=3034157 RepID=UPI0030135417
MQEPVVSVVMPVYNSAAWLREAMDSILQQTFSDFELILIDDGSTDESASIIKSFSDSRIRHLVNEKNRGLVFTLNRGIDEAKGKYIARMDGDDIAVDRRFERQVSYLDSHPEVDLIASVVLLIDDKGNKTGFWKEDKEMLSYEQLREFMPFNNCIAHPSIMARAGVLRDFKYRQDQDQAEDYDLWLRLFAAGKIIHKIEEPLLLHRILAGSYTRKRQRNIFFKLADTKWRFFKNEVRHKHVNEFIVRTMLFSFYDVIRGAGKQIKNLIKS